MSPPSSLSGVSAPPPNATSRAPLLGFTVDLLLGAVIVLGMSLVAGLVWGAYRGVLLGMEAAKGGAALNGGAELAARIGEPGALAQILIALVSTGSAAVILYFWRRRATVAERSQSRQQIRRASTWGWIALVGTLVFVGSSLIAWLGKQWGIEPVPTNLPLMQQAMTQFPVFLMLFAVVLAPAYEELLFRRVLFGRLWAAGRPWLGLLLSSAAFALMHEIPGTGDRAMAEVAQLWLVYGAMGAVFAWLYRRTGTLWAPVIAHGINNGIAMSLLYAGVA